MESSNIDLKTEREKRNLSLAKIAADTHISLRYLQSIEEGRYDDLPGGLYNRAFIKAYCESINLDPKEILDQYESQVSSSQSGKTLQPKIPYSPPQKSFSIPGPVLIWSFLLLISAAGIFFSRGWIRDIFSPYFSDTAAVEEIYQRPDTALPDPALPPLTTEQTQSSNSPEASSPDTLPIAVEEEEPSKTSPSPEAKVASSTAVTINPNLQLEIVAQEQCWISIDIDGTPSTRKLMEPGETEEFNAMDRVHALIGNAGGIQMKINGMPTKPLGNAGEVIRMNIDLGNLQQFIDQPAG